MTKYWNTTIAYLKSTPDHFLGDDLVDQITALAKANLKASYELEFDDFTDEVCCHLVRGKRRCIFVNVQCEGTEQDYKQMMAAIHARPSN